MPNTTTTSGTTSARAARRVRRRFRPGEQVSFFAGLLTSPTPHHGQQRFVLARHGRSPLLPGRSVHCRDRTDQLRFIRARDLFHTGDCARCSRDYRARRHRDRAVCQQLRENGDDPNTVLLLAAWNRHVLSVEDEQALEQAGMAA